MQLPKDISKIKRLIFILALAVVASLCIISIPVSETEAEGNCGSCGRPSTDIHYDRYYSTNHCNGTSQHPAHYWY